MTALALTIAIFGFWSVVGFALVSALYGRSNLVRRALLAPITGAAATALLLVSLNWEIPVRYAGPAATVLLLALTAWLLRTNRVSFRLREMAPFSCAKSQGWAHLPEQRLCSCAALTSPDRRLY